VSRELPVLFSDEHYVAIAKPAGLATIPGRGETDSVLEQLARQLKLPASGDTDPRLRVVHRLDKPTSGVLVFAKDRPAQQHLSHQFQNNLVQKEYLALVTGHPDADSGEIDAPLGLHPTFRLRMAVLKHGGRPARTEWRLEERFKDFALLRCFPKTGKTHQIRVHLMHAGMPLAIDELYNPNAPPAIYLSDFKRGYRRGDADERPLIARLTLHAQRLTFLNIDQRPVTLDAELPKDFRALLNMLRKYALRG
jgi:RluA family pseudouridine synthase